MGSKSGSVERLHWREICRSEQYRGRWVALDNVIYDPATSQPVEADVVDADEDLGDLCARMRESDRTSCAILQCVAETCAPRSFQRRSLAPRAIHH